MTDRNPLDGLYEIVGDLWGGALGRPRPTASGTDAKPAAAKPSAPKAPAEPIVEAPAVVPLEEYWKMVDDTVDWTAALCEARDPDGFTSQRRWDFFRSLARRVLSGDTDAYREVLDEVKPMADLSSYVGSIELNVLSPDTVEAVFETLPQQNRRDIAGLTLRIGRDLASLLPVSHVCVEARHDGNRLFRANFPREVLRKLRVNEVEPEAFSAAFGLSGPRE